MALQTVLPYVVLLTVVVAVRGQIRGCSLESLTDPSSLRTAVISTVSADSPELPANLTIYDHHVVCLAAAEARNEYIYASVVVVFSCVGPTGAGSPLGSLCIPDNYTAQFEFECQGSELTWLESQTPFSSGNGSARAFFNPADANLSTEVDTFCSLCVDPDRDLQAISITSTDPVTHCAGKQLYHGFQILCVLSLYFSSPC